MLTLCGTFIGLEVIDTFLTMWAVNHGFTEANPLMAPIAGSWWCLPAKVLPTLFAVGLLLWATRRWPQLTKGIKAGLIVIICFITAVIGSNIAEF